MVLRAWFSVMALIIKNLSITIGKRELILDESVGIADGSKVGLLGRNGVGKTTLIKAILGQIDYLGSISYDGKAAYFSQHINLDLKKTVRETIVETAAIHHQGTFEEELKQIEKQMADPALYENHDELEKVSKRYSELLAKKESHQTPVSNTKLKQVLQTLEVQESWLDQIVGSLSTGQRAIIALAQILSSDADFLLLDEPTNHLDFKRLDILENYLKYFKGTVLLVSHDRYFLDKVCDSILKIENGKWMKYMGNYSAYVKSRKMNFEAQQSAYTNEKRYIANEKDKIARIGKSPAKVTQGHYRERLLEKREVIEKPDLDQSDFSTHFEASTIHGKLMLELHDVSVGYDKALLEHISLNMGVDQRIILIGENGIGKSTLFKTIEGRLKPLAGKIVLNHNAKIGYADQELRDLDSDNTLYDEIYAMLKDLSETRKHLSMLGFVEDDDVFKSISKLSMGEKSRLNLLKILIEKPNLLLLDEPTNHLDIDAREIIENAFLNYDGAILAVSHDRFFIKKIAERVFKAENGTLKEMVVKKD